MAQSGSAASLESLKGKTTAKLTHRRQNKTRLVCNTFCLSRILATDSAVVEAHFDEHFAIEMVAAVENDRRAHELLDEGKVGIAELGPLRRENEGVGVADRFERIGDGDRSRTEIGPGEIFKSLGVGNRDDRAFGGEIAHYLNGNGGI